MQYHPSQRLKKKLFWTQLSFVVLAVSVVSVLQAGADLGFSRFSYGVFMVPSVFGGIFLWGLAHAFHPAKRVVWLLSLGLMGLAALGAVLLTRLGCAVFAPLPACSSNYLRAADFGYLVFPLPILIVDIALSGLAWVAMRLGTRGR
jgi:hypothetical protein